MSFKPSALEPVYVPLAGDRQFMPDRMSPPRTKIHVLALFLAVSSICLCAVFGAIAVVKLMTEVEKTTQYQPFVCIDCIKLVKNPYNSYDSDPLKDSLTKVYEEGVEKCCARDNQQLSALLEMSMRRQEVKQVPLPVFNVSDFKFSPVSAHQRLYPPYRPAGPRELKPNFTTSGRVLFRTSTRREDPLVEHARGVQVLDGGFHIQYSGIYFIYSSIHYRPDSVYPCKHFKFKTWSHFIMKNTPNNPALTGCLMKTAHTCCDECTLDDETSYTGGVFRLEAGDVIYVEISGHGLVYFKEQTSFAGLMMLGLAN